MVRCNCLAAFALGASIPILICSLIYLLFVFYVIYITHRDHSVDIKKWRKDKFNLVDIKYKESIRCINAQIDMIKNEIAGEACPS